MNDPRFVYMTAKDTDEARKIGRALVERRLVACVNILPGMESIYHWEGKIETASEVVMIAKTTADRVEDLIGAVDRLHSYDCPCIVVLPIVAGHPDYLQWLIGGVTMETNS